MIDELEIENKKADLRYSLSKQLRYDDDPMEISTNYGIVPLEESDIIAVRKLLRKRFEARLKKMEGK